MILRGRSEMVLFLKIVATLLSCVIIFMLAALMLSRLTGVGDQIKATQKARTDFSEMCAKQDGTVVTNYKGTPYKLCFSADGRLVGSY
jgi:hypothetical protein